MGSALAEGCRQGAGGALLCVVWSEAEVCSVLEMATAWVQGGCARQHEVEIEKEGVQPMGDQARSGGGWQISRARCSSLEVRRQGRRSWSGDRGGEECYKGWPMGSSAGLCAALGLTGFCDCWRWEVGEVAVRKEEVDN